MKQKLGALTAVVLFLVMLVVPTFASMRTRAEASKVVTVEGTVTDFWFINPLVKIYLEVKDDQLNIRKWNGECSNPFVLHRLRRNNEILKPSAQVTLDGYRSRKLRFCGRRPACSRTANSSRFSLEKTEKNPGAI